jgi:hypothetical protein
VADDVREHDLDAREVGAGLGRRSDERAEREPRDVRDGDHLPILPARLAAPPTRPQRLAQGVLAPI